MVDYEWLPTVEEFKEKLETEDLKQEDQNELLNYLKQARKHVFDKKGTTNKLGCILATGTEADPAKGKHYIRVSLGKHAYKNAHVLAYNLKGLEVSHRCHHQACWNPEHLVLETKAQNLARNKCQGWTWITCPCPCNYSFNPCKHNPPCILPKE